MADLRAPARSRERDLLSWLERLDVDGWPGPDDCQRALADLRAQGHAVRHVAWSPQRRELQSVTVGSGGRRVLAWGYPHPDEPLGAAALLALARALARDIPAVLADLQLTLVACADPDGAARNTWTAQPSLSRFLREHHRPVSSDLEVDYMFPVDHGVLYQPRFWAPEGVPLPLAESVGLADLLERVQPHVVGLLHDHHCSGAYTFLSAPPSPSLLSAFSRVARWSGVRDHTGRLPDAGRHWTGGSPHALAEPRLADHVYRLRERFGTLDGHRVAGPVPASVFCQTLPAPPAVITPEAGLWRARALGDAEPLDCPPLRWRTVAGRQAAFAAAQLPDGQQVQLLVHLGDRAAQPALAAHAAQVVAERAWWLARLERIWQQHASALAPSAQVQERRLTRQAAGDALRRSAWRLTVEEPALARREQIGDLRARSLFDCALGAGQDRQLLLAAGADAAAAQIDRLLVELEEQLEPLIEPVDPGALVRSQLARLLLVALGQR